MYGNETRIAKRYFLQRQSGKGFELCRNIKTKIMNIELLINQAKLIVEEFEKSELWCVLPEDHNEKSELILLYISAKKMIERYG